MPTPNAYLANEQERIVFVNGVAKQADFQVKCTAVAFKTTANCYIAFDRPATSDDFLLEAADRVVELHPPMEFTFVSAMGAGGGGTLYIMARR